MAQSILSHTLPDHLISLKYSYPFPYHPILLRIILSHSIPSPLPSPPPPPRSRHFTCADAKDDSLQSDRYVLNLSRTRQRVEYSQPQRRGQGHHGEGHTGRLARLRYRCAGEIVRHAADGCVHSLKKSLEGESIEIPACERNRT